MIPLVILMVPVLSWIEEKLCSSPRCYDPKIIQWVDKDRKIFKYIKKRTGYTDEENSILFIDWAKFRRNSVKKVASAFKNNVNKQEKNKGLKTVDQQTSISNVRKTRCKEQCTGMQQSKSMKPTIEKNIPIQNGEVSSSTESLPPCQSLLNNFPSTTIFPSKPMDIFTNLDHQLEVFSQQTSNQNSHGSCNEYLQASNSGFFHEVPSVHYLLTITNAISEIVEPDLSELEESLYDLKFCEDFSTQSEQKQPVSPFQTLGLSLSSIENLAEIELEQPLVPSVVQSDWGNIWHDSYAEYGINPMIEIQDISV